MNRSPFQIVDASGAVLSRVWPSGRAYAYADPAEAARDAAALALRFPGARPCAAPVHLRKSYSACKLDYVGKAPTGGREPRWTASSDS